MMILSAKGKGQKTKGWNSGYSAGGWRNGRSVRSVRREKSVNEWSQYFAKAK